MATFKIQEHVPDVYPRKSRDFQLFCAVFNCIFGDLKFNIDSIRDVTETAQCSERLLSLLQTKLGFFTNVKIPNDELRTILRAFPTIVRNKGSRTGIEQALQVFLKIKGIEGESLVEIKNKENSLSGNYIIHISVKNKLPDTTILTEILKYVLPAGYILKYSLLNPSGDNGTTVYEKDTVNIVLASEDYSSGVRPSVSSTDEYSEMLGRVDSTFVKNAASKGELTYTDLWFNNK